MVNIDNKTLLEVAEIATSYSGIKSEQEDFIRIVKENPELEDSFKSQYSEEFSNAVKKKGIYLIMNHRSWKKGTTKKPTLKVYYCGREESPTISIDC